MSFENVEIKDTTEIQAMSLRRVLEQIGYAPNVPKTNKGEDGRINFKAFDRHYVACNVIGFDTAVKLHNCGPEGWTEFAPGWFTPSFKTLDIAVSAFKLAEIYSARIVKQVKWQKAKNVPLGVQLQSHKVKLAQPYFANSVGLNS